MTILLAPPAPERLSEIAQRHFALDQVDDGDVQTWLPRLARDRSVGHLLRSAVREVTSRHSLVLGDARRLESLADASVHLVLTSPPYWTLKQYRETEGQLGHVEGYQQFLDELDRVWRHCCRVLVPGGRLIVVVGDVCVSRKKFKRHLVMPLHASIQERCRGIGFDNLAPRGRASRRRLLPTRQRNRALVSEIRLRTGHPARLHSRPSPRVRRRP